MRFLTKTQRPSLQKPGLGEGREEPLYVDEEGYSVTKFLVPAHYIKSIDRILVPHGFVLDRIEKLAYDILNFYDGEELNLLCVLKGSRAFFSHLMQYFNKLSAYDSSPRDGPAYMEHYVRIKSYEDTEPTGKFGVIAEDLSGLKGKHVLIVEDIVDTGVTLTKFCSWLEEKVQPKKIAVATLLEKRTSKSNGFKADFVGFSVPDKFVVGFSCDYNERFRDLEHISVITDEAVRAYSVKK